MIRIMIRLVMLVWSYRFSGKSAPRLGEVFLLLRFLRRFIAEHSEIRTTALSVVFSVTKKKVQL